MPAPSDRPATVDDVHRLAAAMPRATRWPGSPVVYQVSRRSFVFFRNPRPDAVDPETGERYPDVIMFWVGSLADKQAMVDDPHSPFFTTPHFDGHPSVLVRAARLGEIDVTELAEIVADAWLSRAPKTVAARWLADHAQPPG
jgi:hypothetical protein